ncbi:MAG: hypothetical protein LC658_16395, partial [Bacteroidales bacterium]|nr:hypothetical protein [Bacteroidales bacterium]
MNKPFIFLTLFFIHTLVLSQSVPVEFRKEISQYGITWEFDKPMQTGQFITGDWWVVGAATIVQITPAPGPVSADNSKISINHWNDTSLKTDTTMRNGSAIVLKAGHTQS